MAYRFQYVFLVALFLSVVPVVGVMADETVKSTARAKDINAEFFDAGIIVGVINIEDFTSEFVIGTSFTVKASEDFFLQANYVWSDVSLSSVEEDQGPYFAGDDRTFQHHDVLLGYNLFHGEFFTGSVANLATLYLVGGVGFTDFGGEENFTYTLGFGYQVAFKRHILLRFDFRDYIYKTSLVASDNTTNNFQLSAGISYLF